MEYKLQYRERLMLYILAALGVARIWDLTILAGYNNYKYTSNKLQYLKSLKLVSSAYLDRKVVYFLTARGYREIGRNHSAYRLNSTSQHDIEVTRIATWLYLAKGISYADLLTDRQMKYLMKGSKIHRPDIVLQNVAFEFEKTPKANARLKSNLLANKKYEKQVWVIPDDKNYLAERIKRFSRELLLDNVEVLMLGKINDVVLNADISTNKVRARAVLGERNTDILFETSDADIKKYFR